MRGENDPIGQAQAFELPVELDNNQLMEKLPQLFFYLAQFPEINSGLTAQAWLFLAQLKEAMQMTASAQSLREAFGEVKVEDRHYLPLVSVYFALLHNSLEAQTRENEQLDQLLAWLVEAETLLIEREQELEQKITIKNSELKNDRDDKDTYRRGITSSYSEANGEGKKGLWHYTRVISQGDLELEQLKEELRELQNFRVIISSFVPLVYSESNQRLNMGLK